MHLHRLTDRHAAAAAARRGRLAHALGGRPALLGAGTLRPRRYPGDPYPFRAASHFLYLVGLSWPGAYVLVDGGDHALYVPDPAPDDALWHGPTPSLGEVGARLGVAVRPASELPGALAGLDGVGTVPTPDRLGCEALSRLLGRPVEPGLLGNEADAAVADAMIALRLIHDELAVEGLREAADAAALAFEAGREAARPGVVEWEVRAAMERPLTARGLTTSFSPIVSTRGEVLHNHHHHRTMEAGDLLLVDFGAEGPQGWASDVTRTWPVGGGLSSTQREIYEVVLAAQEAAIAAVAPGVRYREVHMAACRTIAEGLVALGVLVGDPAELVSDGVHALFFPHGVGHLLGLDVHDMEDLGDRAGYGPGLSRGSQFGLSYLRLDRVLEPGMAVTIEPGFYAAPAILEDEALRGLAAGRIDRQRLEDFADVRGIRIEDDVLVTEDGAEVLTADIPKAPGAIARA